MDQMIKGLNEMRNDIRKAAKYMTLLFVAALLTGCGEELQDEYDLPGITEDSLPVVEVPVAIEIENQWNIDEDEESRAVPPGIENNTGNGGTESDATTGKDDGLAETESVDQVALFVYRRRVNEDSESPAMISEADYDSFEYDASNYQLLLPDPDALPEIKDELDEPKNHKKIFRGKLKKVYGWEYKVTAVAYSTTRPTSFIGEDGKAMFKLTNTDLDRFNFNVGTTYKELSAQLSVKNDISNLDGSGFNLIIGSGYSSVTGTNIFNDKLLEAPQLFYGDCYTETNSGKRNIIRFSDINHEGANDSEIPLKGVLFRGMAKVEVHIEKYPEYEYSLGNRKGWKCICLMADAVLTEVGLRNYDDFLQGSSSLGGLLPKRDGSSKGVFVPVSFYHFSDTDNNTQQEKVLEAYFLPGKTNLLLRTLNAAGYWGDVSSYHLNGWIKPGDEEADMGLGTGIVSPDSHDGAFYLRRNHKYKIVIKNLANFMKSAPEYK